jgi:hypothetical protein
LNFEQSQLQGRGGPLGRKAAFGPEQAKERSRRPAIACKWASASWLNGHLELGDPKMGILKVCIIVEGLRQCC